MRLKQVFEYYDQGDGKKFTEYKYCPQCQAPMIFVEIGNIERPKCSSCEFVYYQNPSPTVSILIVDGDKILLGKRTEYPGKGEWAIPSGYIEYGQDFITAGVVEAREETGLEVEIQSIVNVMSSFYSQRYHFVSIYVKARVIGGTLKAGDDLEEVKWYCLAENTPKLAFLEDQEMIGIFQTGKYEEITVDKRYARGKNMQPNPSD